MENTTLIKLPKEEIIAMAEASLVYIRKQREERREENIQKLLEETKGFWKWKQNKYTEEEAKKIVDNFWSDEISFWDNHHYLYSSQSIRLKELIKISTYSKVEEIYLGQDDWNLLQWGKRNEN